MLLQHIFRAYARRIGIDGQQIGLKFISRRSRRSTESVIPPSVSPFRTLFRSFGVRRAIRRPRVSRILPRPRRNSSSTRLCNLQSPYPDADSTTRRLAHRNFSLSVRPLLFLLLHTRATRVPKASRGSGFRSINCCTRQSGRRQYLLGTYSDRLAFPRQSRNL